MAGWRYIARRLNGDGTETGLDGEVPLSGVELTEDLSGPGGITGSISPEIARLKSRDAPLLVPWSTAIYAECDGQIRAGAILVDLDDSTPELKLDCVGFTGYAAGIPYTSEKVFIKQDPLDIARHIWEHIQDHKNGNLGIKPDTTSSRVRIGDDPNDPDAKDPYRLIWFQDHDLGAEFDKLAADTPFEYRMQHVWAGEDIAHRLVLGYPRLGRRRTDLRFVVGENIGLAPPIDYDGSEYADEAIVLGAGEGREMIRGTLSRNSGRLRRPVVVMDKNIRAVKDAVARAGREVAWRLGSEDITQIDVRDHDHAKYGTYQVGDEILIETAPGWSEPLALWCRVLSIGFKPESNVATISVARADKVV
ncbi:hypothetical protein ACSYDW_01375 [Paeniglutamicibacter sp. R2-26]|uniref:hypothetical protein n=1 Tax=Paeniglutamicibacter sp. R2-26 TaxID=3144417 RepID=UPI003EE61A66